MMVNATALTENKTSCQEAAVGTVFFPNSLHLKHWVTNYSEAPYL